ncbi:hypothetical protein NITMOv2_2836 [Nitrospira moscoviensis]|uniref:Uncharacterized protein n=1 Tax=Nitrospira moscoviensis TaxID=42253 RepID=A0A0K2GEF7_NITMO|nr:hypothetical protein NITMOv2_2836 [Nitrospira moscoviensis]
MAGDQIQTSPAADARRGTAWASAVPDPLWIPAVVGGLILAVGGLGWLVGRPWLSLVSGRRPTCWRIRRRKSPPAPITSSPVI